MPELAEFTEALRADLTTVRWPDATDVRVRGHRRTRRGRLVGAGVVAAILAVAGLGAASTQLSKNPLQPAGRQPGAPPTTPGGQAVRWPAGVVLPDDVGYGFRLNSADLPGIEHHALDACPADTPLAAEDVGDGAGATYVRASGGQVDEEIVQYRPGSAISGIKYDLADRLNGACRDSYQVIVTGVTGDESAIVHPVSPVLPGSYEAFVAVDDFLIWLRVELAVDGVDQLAYTKTLAVRAAAKLHCEVTTLEPTC